MSSHERHNWLTKQVEVTNLHKGHQSSILKQFTFKIRNLENNFVYDLTTHRWIKLLERFKCFGLELFHTTFFSKLKEKNKKTYDYNEFQGHF